jgi:hypothetical protein
LLATPYIVIDNKRYRIPKGQSTMENPENTERAIENGESRGSSNKTNKKKKTKAKHKMSWTSLCASKHK